MAGTDLTCILRMQREAASRHVTLLAPKNDLAALFGSLGAPWDPLEAPLEHSQARLGHFGTSRGTAGMLEGSSWELSWRSWGTLGTSRVLLNPPSIDFGRILGRLGGPFLRWT